jgi:hypothetical protein
MIVELKPGQIHPCAVMPDDGLWFYLSHPLIMTPSIKRDSRGVSDLDAYIELIFEYLGLFLKKIPTGLLSVQM